MIAFFNLIQMVLLLRIRNKGPWPKAINKETSMLLMEWKLKLLLPL